MNNINQIDEIISEISPNLERLQSVINATYGKYDKDKSLLWFVEEVGELIASIRKEKSIDEIRGEMADVLAWTLCLINILGFEITDITRIALLKEGNRQLAVYGKLKYWNG